MKRLLDDLDRWLAPDLVRHSRAPLWWSQPSGKS